MLLSYCSETCLSICCSFITSHSRFFERSSSVFRCQSLIRCFDVNILTETWTKNNDAFSLIRGIGEWCVPWHLFRQQSDVQIVMMWHFRIQDFILLYSLTLPAELLSFHSFIDHICLKNPIPNTELTSITSHVDRVVEFMCICARWAVLYEARETV